MRKLAIVFATFLLAACASLFGDAPPAKVSDGMFVDEKGMTLYTFDRDAPGKIACVAQCAVNWPPLIAPADAKSTGDWTVVPREDGRKQWAYKGKPVYTWVKDTKPGDKTGDGFNNLWRVARP